MKVTATTKKEAHQQGKSSAEASSRKGTSLFAPGNEGQHGINDNPVRQQASLPAQRVAQLTKFEWQNGGWVPIVVDSNEMGQLHEPPTTANEGDTFDDQTGEFISASSWKKNYSFDDDELDFTDFVSNNNNRDVEIEVEEQEEEIKKTPVRKRKRELKKKEKEEKKDDVSSSSSLEETESKKLKQAELKPGKEEKKKSYELGEGIGSKITDPVKFFIDHLSGNALAFYQFIQNQPTVTLKFETAGGIPDAKAITKLFVKLGNEFVNTEDDDAAIFNQWHLVNKDTPMQVTIIFDVTKNKNYLHTLENLLHEFTVHAMYYRKFIEKVLATDNTKGEVGLEYFTNNSYGQYLSGYHQHHEHFVNDKTELPEYQKNDPSGITKEEYNAMKKKWDSFGATSGNKDFNEQVIRYAALLKKEKKNVQDFMLKAKEDVNSHTGYKVRDPLKSKSKISNKETSVVDEDSIPPRPKSLDALLTALGKGETKEIALVIMGMNGDWIGLCERWLIYGGNRVVSPGEVQGLVENFQKTHSDLVDKKADPAQWLGYPGPENTGEAILEHISLEGDPADYLEVLKELPKDTLLQYIQFRDAYHQLTGKGGEWKGLSEFIESLYVE